MTSTLSRYVFFRTLKNTLFFLIGVGAIALLIDFTEFSNRTGSLPDYSATGALLVSAMRVPLIIQIAVPFIMLFATVATLIGLNRKYELVIARASGVSAWAFLRPTWLCALLIGLVFVLVINPLAALGFSKANEIEGLWRGAGQGSVLEQEAPFLRQPIDTGGSWIISAQRSANFAGTPRLLGATFVQMADDGSIRQRLDAKRADLEDGAWQLIDVTVTQPGSAPVVEDSRQIATTLDASVIAEAL
ncbi:MAG: LptF/LptG family permease, partial [Pseudomonadota bacterium]